MTQLDLLEGNLQLYCAMLSYTAAGWFLFDPLPSGTGTNKPRNLGCECCCELVCCANLGCAMLCFVMLWHAVTTLWRRTFRRLMQHQL